MDGERHTHLVHNPTHESLRRNNNTCNLCQDFSPTLLGFLMKHVVTVMVPLTFLIFWWAKTNETIEIGVEKHLDKRATYSTGNSSVRITTINYKHYNKLSLLECKLPSLQPLCINHQ